MELSNTKIYVYTHTKDFPLKEFYEKDDRYEIITNNNIQSRFINNDLQPSFNEPHGICYVWENGLYKDYDNIGFCHYRSYLDITNPHISEKRYKVIVGEPLKFKQSLYEQWDQPHEFLDITLNLIYNYSKEIYWSAVCHINRNILYRRNHFIMRVEDFKEYADFAFTITNRFCRHYNWETYNDVVKYCEDHKKDYPLLNLEESAIYNEEWEYYKTVEYNCRTLGFLYERLTSIWLSYKYKPEEIFLAPIIIKKRSYTDYGK